MNSKDLELVRFDFPVGLVWFQHIFSPFGEGLLLSLLAPWEE